jgi:polar amino acid transport system substrate-binding protein
MKRTSLVILVLALAVGAVGAAALGETYSVVTDPSWPPFEWVDPAGNIIGFDIDVMRCVAALEGYEITIQSYEWEIIFEDVGIGRVDIGASGATITPARSLMVDFSVPYWTSDQAILVRTKEDPDNPGELIPEMNVVEALTGGYKIGAQLETTGAGWVQGELIDKGFSITLQEYPLYPLAVLDLINGNIDVVIQDEPASRTSAEAEDAITINGIIVTNEQFGYFVAKGDPNGLLPKIESGINKLKASGAWENLVNAYMGADQAKLEAAWVASKPLLDAGDVDGFAKSLVDLANQ